MTLRQHIKKAGRWVVIGLSAGILFSILVFAFFQTDYGKKQAERLIERAVTKGSNFRTEITGLGGLIPFHPQMDGLAFSDDSGEWLRLKGVSVRINPIALFMGRLHLREVRSAFAHVIRIPKERKKTEPGSKSWRLPIQGLGRLQIDRLEADRMTLGSRVLGEKVVLKVRGRFMSSTPQGDRVISLSMVTAEGPRGKALVNAKLRGGGPVLALRVEVEEPATGILGKAAGMGGPLKLSLRGDGPIRAWKGKLSATLGSMGTLSGEIDLETGSEHKFSMRSTFRPGKDRISSDLAAWLGPHIRSTFVASLRKNGALVIDGLTMEARRASFRLSGPLDLDRKDSSGRVTLEIRDFGPLAARWNLKGMGNLRIAGDVSGLTTQPEARLKVSVSDVAVGVARAERLEGDLRLGLLGPTGLPFPGFRLTGKGRVEGIAHQEGSTLPESSLNWELNAEGPSQHIVEISRLRFLGKSLTLDLSGRFHTISKKGKFDAELKSKDLRPLSVLLGFELAGAARLKADIEANARTGSLTARIQGKVNAIESDHHPITGLMGKEVTLKGDLALKGPGQLRLSNAHLKGLPWNLKCDGSLDLSEGRVNGSWRLSVPQLSAFAPVLGRDLSGSLQADGSVKGALQKPRMTATVSTQDFALEGVRFRQASARLELDGLPPDAQGHAIVEWVQTTGKTSAKARFSIQGGRVSLSPVRIQGRGVTAEGRLIFHMDRRLAEGELKGKWIDLSVLSPLLEEKIAGGAELEIKLAIRGSKQVVTFDVAAKDLATRLGKAGRMELRGEITDPLGSPSGKAGLEVKNFQLKTVDLAYLKLELKGGRGRVTFQGKGKGRYVEDFEVETSGIVEATIKGQKVTLDRLTGKYGGFPITLTRGTSIEHSASRLAFDPVAFKVGDGHVRGSGVLGQGADGLRMEVNALPLAVVPVPGLPALKGKVSGRIHIQDQGAWAKGDMTLDFLEVRLRGPEYAELPPAGVQVKIGLRRDGLNAKLVIKGLSPHPFTAKADIPVTLSLWPPAWTLAPQGELKGELSGRLGLEKIPALAGLDDQRLDGQMDVSLVMEGTVESPKVRGGVRVEKASYENFRSGTILKNIILEMAAQNERLLIERARATDGDKGIISAQGWIDFLAKKGFPLEVTLALDKATLLRQDRMKATVGGRLKVLGSIQEAVLKGTLHVEAGEVSIPERLPAAITELEVVEINRPESEKVLPVRKGTARVKPTKLDVQMECPGRVFVRGRGLDSEWRGNLKVTGTTVEPVITGTLSVVRGRYKFLGKTFNLQEGRVTFGGSSPPAPMVNVLAKSSTKDLTAVLKLTGPIEGPEIELTSEPALPTEEILSRLLFDREAAKITPLQAVQLANALNTMVGGKGFDPLRPAREWLGLDALEIGESGAGSGEMALGAGKYLGERVYLRVERGAGAKSGKASVEVEITPNITMETEVGEEADAGVGLNWKWSY